MVKRLALFSVLTVAMGMTAACTHQASSAPSLTGPSQLALAVTMTANPDRISLDGGSQSLITAQVRGPNGQVEPNVPLRVDMVVNGVVQDYGTLNARNIVTGTDGNAFVTYTAPLLATLATQTIFTVSIQVVIVGTDAVAAATHNVAIALVPAGVILPPADTPTASFTAPSPVSLNVPGTYDASSSCPGAKNANGCLPSSSATITSYAWNFGDGSTGAGQTVSHTFGTIGTFTVTLTITNARGIVASTSQAVTVSAPALAPPIASFTVSPAAPAVNQTALFNASASTPGVGHSIASYAWTFGDGGTASGVTTSHAYAAAGVYTVQLKVTDEDNESALSTSTISPGVGTPAPTANFTFSPAAPGKNDQVVFDASSSTTAAGQTIVSVAWNFGDGTPIITCPGGPVASCPGPTIRISAHTFMIAQTFQVNLVVTDSTGAIGSHGTSVTIAAALPQVVATASPSGPIPGQSVFFNSSATTYYPGTTGVSTFAWTFGDGGTSTLANPTHAYGAVGAYSVGLSVTDGKGRTGVGGTTVSVAAVTPPTPPAPPVANFSISPTPVSAGSPVNFMSTSTTPSGAAITSYTWTFGDTVSCPATCGGGTVAPFSTVNHTYPVVGVSGTVTTYNVSLTVKDTNGLSSVFSEPVLVTTP